MINTITHCPRILKGGKAVPVLDDLSLMDGGEWFSFTHLLLYLLVPVG
jgi:hypothetical protein